MPARRSLGSLLERDRSPPVRGNASLTRPAYIEADLRRIFEGEAVRRFRRAVAADPFEPFRPAGTPAVGLRARTLARGRAAARASPRAIGCATASRRRCSASATGSSRTPITRRCASACDRRAAAARFLRPAAAPRLSADLPARGRGSNCCTRRTAPAAATEALCRGLFRRRLRDRAVRRAAWDRHHDRWEGLLITFAALARGEPRLGLPALDGLFAHGTIPDLETAKLANRNLMEAIYRLAWLKEDSGLVPVNWRDMETEELGSVYESLLELTPRLTDDGRGFAFAEGGEARATPARRAAAITRPTASCRHCSTARSTRCSTASRRRPTIRPPRCCR